MGSRVGWRPTRSVRRRRAPITAAVTAARSEPPAPLRPRRRRPAPRTSSATRDPMSRRPRVLAIDAGGTMTDTFLVDEGGAFVVGKAQTTPEDESAGFMASAEDALGQWDSTPEEAFPAVVSGIYSGTAMLNRLLSRQGRRIGAIVTAGQEDYLQLERGILTYLGYSYADRLHVATHHHNQPIVERELMKGVRGRID